MNAARRRQNKEGQDREKRRQTDEATDTPVQRCTRGGAREVGWLGAHTPLSHTGMVIVAAAAIVCALTVPCRAHSCACANPCASPHASYGGCRRSPQTSTTGSVLKGSYSPSSSRVCGGRKALTRGRLFPGVVGDPCFVVLVLARKPSAEVANRSTGSAYNQPPTSALSPNRDLEKQSTERLCLCLRRRTMPRTPGDAEWTQSRSARHLDGGNPLWKTAGAARVCTLSTIRVPRLRSM